MEYFFAPCPRGLENLAAQEFESLCAQSVRQTEGGVHFDGEFSLAYRVNLESHLASRVLWQCAQSDYVTDQDVYEIAYRLPWSEWFNVDRTIRVSVTGRNCPLKSLEFITLKIKDAICDKFRAQTHKRPEVDKRTPEIRIHAYLDRSKITLYLDTSGEPLFKRGLRLSQADASLKENLAAGLLKLAQWTPDIPLLDPMCGGGTILIEAALIALDIAPGGGRSFAFENLNNFKKTQWDKLRTAARDRIKPTEKREIYGSDLYGDVLKQARANLSQAGLENIISLKQANVLEISAPAKNGMIVTNPPYGVRLGEVGDLEKFYPALGDVLKKKFAGWEVYIFSGDLRLPKLIGLNPSRRTLLFNGGLECRLFKFVMVEGSMRKRKIVDEEKEDNVD